MHRHAVLLDSRRRYTFPPIRVVPGKQSIGYSSWEQNRKLRCCCCCCWRVGRHLVFLTVRAAGRRKETKVGITIIKSFGPWERKREKMTSPDYSSKCSSSPCNVNREEMNRQSRWIGEINSWGIRPISTPLWLGSTRHPIPFVVFGSIRPRLLIPLESRSAPAAFPVDVRMMSFRLFFFLFSLLIICSWPPDLSLFF